MKITENSPNQYKRLWKKEKFLFSKDLYCRHINVVWERLNPLPNDKIFDWSKLKEFTDKKNVTEKLKFVLGRVEKIMGKGENVGYQHFLLF